MIFKMKKNYFQTKIEFVTLCVFFLSIAMFVFGCVKKANDEADANQEILSAKAEIIKYTQTIAKSMRVATEKTLVTQQGRADLDAFMKQFDSEMAINSGSNYKSNLITFEYWNPKQKSLKSYLTQYQVSDQAQLYVNKVISAVTSVAHKFDKFNNGSSTPELSDFTVLSKDINKLMVSFEKEAFQDSKMSDVDRKVVLNVTTIIPILSDEIVNTCISYYQNSDRGLHLRCFLGLCDLWQTVVNAIVTIVVVVIVFVVVAAIVYFTGGLGFPALFGIGSGAATWAGFLAWAVEAGIGLTAVKTAAAQIAFCNGICLFEEPVGHRCFCN
jgi:hypothetical protein